MNCCLTMYRISYVLILNYAKLITKCKLEQWKSNLYKFEIVHTLTLISWITPKWKQSQKVVLPSSLSSVALAVSESPEKTRG